jgi:hypothetical protein
MVAQRKWPPGGLKQLQDICLQEVSWLELLLEHPIFMSKAIYDRFLQLVAAVLYCFSSQGRRAAVLDLKFNQYKDLILNGFVMSTKFKTYSKFGFQPITCSRLLAQLIEIYVDKFRPKHFVGDKDPLFLNYVGQQVRYILYLL